MRDKLDTVLKSARDRVITAPPLSQKLGRPQKVSDRVVRLALKEYRAKQDTAKAIANRYGVSVATLRGWVDAAGYRRRPLGRQPLTEPTSEQKCLLAQIGAISLSQLARQVGKSRQYLAKLAERWPDWLHQK